MRLWSKFGALAAACLVAVVLCVCAEREANACTCAPHVLENPKEGRLPIDGAIIVSDPFEVPVTVDLRDDAGASVGLVTSEVSVGEDGGRLNFFRPVSELVLGDTYSLAIPGFANSDVTAVAALDEPEIPVVKEIRYDSGDLGTCGTFQHAEFELENASGTIVVDIDSESTFDPETLSGTLSGVGTFIGKGPCWFDWSGARDGASARARVGSINESGRFSGWSKPFQLKFPGEPEGGCSLRAPRSRNAGFLELVALVVAAVVTRAARRRAIC